MHLCTCKIMLGGDTGNILVRDQFTPVSWPEIAVIQFLHGEESVFDIAAFKHVERKPAVEKERLGSIYNNRIVEELYPGRSPSMEMEMPGTTLPDEDEGGASKAKHAKPSKRPAPTTSIPPLNADEDEEV